MKNGALGALTGCDGVQNLVVCMPSSGRPGIAEYFPVATSELIDTPGFVQPLIIGPSALTPSWQIKEIEELAKGNCFLEDEMQ